MRVPIFVAFPDRFPSSTVGRRWGGHGRLRRWRISGFWWTASRLWLCPLPVDLTHRKKTNGIRLRQSSGGPQQMQAPLTHLNAVTGWQQKNKGRLEQSADFLSFSYKLTLWVGDVMWCKHSSSVVSQGLLECNFVLGLNIQVCIDLDNLRLDWHISSCSKCQHGKKTPPTPTKNK